MGTIIEQVTVAHGGWRARHSALRLAVSASRACLTEAHCSPTELDLIVNAGLYRDKNLGEPALAALIQQDIGANPEDPHADAHGTFSFDVTNGTCGMLTALQIVDGFLRSGAIHHGLVVASDADPGSGMSEHFPYSPTGAAVLCSWTNDEFGIGPFQWENFPDGGESLRATVGLAHGRNVLQIFTTDSMNQQFAVAAAKVAAECVQRAGIELAEVDLIVAAPATPEFRGALASHLGVSVDLVVGAEDEHVHTAALAVGFHDSVGQGPAGRTLLLVTAAAGITAGAAVYREPSARNGRAPFAGV